MLLKILIIGGGLYFLYRNFIANIQLVGKQQDQDRLDEEEEDDGEYIDYEEVD